MIYTDLQAEQITSYLNILGKSFMKKFAMRSYTFDRVYDDGTCFRLSTNPEMIRYLEENQNLITAPIPEYLLKKGQFIYFAPDSIANLKPQFLDLEFKRRFEINSVVYIIERKPGYYDQLWFTSADEFEVTVSKCINDLGEVQCFFSEFKDQASQLIETTAQEYRYSLSPSRISNLKGLELDQNTENDTTHEIVALN